MGNTRPLTTVGIELSDDGMRLRKMGFINEFSYICQENPELIACVIAVKKEAQLIRANNMKVWS